MRPQNLLRTFAALAAAALLALPAAAQQASFSTFVVLGDSVAMGFLDNCIVDYGQHDVFGAILARQANATFEQPTISRPGLGGCLYLTSLAPTFGQRPNEGLPTNATLPRPYNNLAVGGFKMGDLVNTNPTTPAGGLAYIVLRGQGTAVQQAAALHPTFVGVNVGGNDVLGAAVYGTPIDGVTMTPLPIFDAQTKQVMDGLKAAQDGTAKGFFNTIPDVTLIAFVNAVSPVLGTNPATGAPIYALSTADCPTGVPACPVPVGSKLTLNAAALLQTGYGVPCAIKPNLPNCNKPLPDNLTVDPSTGAITPGVVLTPAEISVIEKRVNDLNSIVAAQAAAAGYRVFDVNPVFRTVASPGLLYGGLTVNAGFLTGGFFSYDGVHPTSLGQAVLANELVGFINDTWGNDLPEVNFYPYIFNGNTSPGGYPTGAATAPLTNAEMIEWAAAIYSRENWEKGLKDLFPQPEFGRRAVGNTHGTPVSIGHEAPGGSDRIH
jgi:lysophospholipase L1-like esterase